MVRRTALKAAGVLVPAAASLLLSVPAAGLTEQGGAGVVVGSVTLSPGYGIPVGVGPISTPSPTPTLPSISVQTAAPQTFWFNSIQIDGVFSTPSTAPVGAPTCLSTNLSATGVSGSSGVLGNIAEDMGTINPFTASGTCGLGVDGGSGEPLALNATAGGTFVRVGALVSITLAGEQCQVGAAVFSCDVRVWAEFTPASPTQNPLVDFSLRGTFAMAA